MQCLKKLNRFSRQPKTFSAFSMYGLYILLKWYQSLRWKILVSSSHPFFNCCRIYLLLMQRKLRLGRSGTMVMSSLWYTPTSAAFHPDFNESDFWVAICRTLEYPKPWNYVYINWPSYTSHSERSHRFRLIC